MKLSDYAKSQGISYRTAWNWWKKGLLKGHQLPTGTIIIDPNSPHNHNRELACIYARVSRVEHQDDLDRQVECLTEFALTKKYKIHRVVKEVSSGLNDHRKQLLGLLKKFDYTVLIIEDKNKLTPFGADYLIILLEQLGKKVEIMQDTPHNSEDLMADFISSVELFSQKIYGKHLSKWEAQKFLEDFHKELAGNDES